MSGEKLNIVFREPPIISDEQEDIEILSDWLFIFEQIYLNYKNKKIAKIFREQNINELKPYIFSKHLAREKETEEILKQRKAYKNV